MPRLVLPRDDLRRILRHRRACGGDRYDEVWDGVYVMSPLADNEHQEMSTGLAAACRDAPDLPVGARVFAGTNISDREDNWRKNYRCPDVAVFLPGNPARDRDSHWLGGPDFAVEVLSRGDRSRKKFDFYAAVGVRELLLVSRRPWRLELYRRIDGGWTLVGNSEPGSSEVLRSEVLPLSLRLVPAEPRPKIEVSALHGARCWLA